MHHNSGLDTAVEVAEEAPPPLLQTPTFNKKTFKCKEVKERAYRWRVGVMMVGVESCRGRDLFLVSSWWIPLLLLPHLSDLREIHWVIWHHTLLIPIPKLWHRHPCCIPLYITTNLELLICISTASTSITFCFQIHVRALYKYPALEFSKDSNHFHWVLKQHR